MFCRPAFRKLPLANHFSLLLSVFISCALVFATLVIPGRAAVTRANGQGGQGQGGQGQGGSGQGGQIQGGQGQRRGRPDAGPPAANLNGQGTMSMKNTLATYNQALANCQNSQKK